jgi:hypothetical protein
MSQKVREVDNVNLRWIIIQEKTLAPLWNKVLIMSPYLLLLR